MNSCVVIPARYRSTRFPGKPLVSLLGKPMILWVAELSARAVGKDHVYVATDDTNIASVVAHAGFQSLMTSPNALTGTDRVAEAAELLNYDVYVNVQGDEPLVTPADIRQCISLKIEKPESVINGFSWLGEDEDPTSVNIPKVIMNESKKMIYMSRLALPGYKDESTAPDIYAKQVCIYGFNKNQLRMFKNYDKKAMLEHHEDIEILRFLELDCDVHMYECRSRSLAVDVPDDVKKVEERLAEDLQP